MGDYVLQIVVCDDEKIITLQIAEMIIDILPDCNIYKYLSGHGF